MKFESLARIPPWEWPEDAGRTILKVLRDNQAKESERLLAAEMAAEIVVINDELADNLLAVVHDGGQTEKLRGAAAIALGPMLELANAEGFDGPPGPEGFEDEDAVPITENTFKRIQDSLRELYHDAQIPKLVRRRVLEAAVRAPQDWQRDAIRAAYQSGAPDWVLTAVFGMAHVKGFEREIVQSLDSKDPLIVREAVFAAGNWELSKTWPRIEAILTSKQPDKLLLLAAMEAAAVIRPEEAGPLLAAFTDHPDEEISDAAYEAMMMAEGCSEDGSGFDGEDS